MGFSLKRLARKAVRGIGKLGKPVLAGALASNPVTAAGARAVTNLKAAAVASKAARLKIQPVSVRANVSKMAVPSPGATMAGPKGLISARGGSRKRRRSASSPDLDAIVAAAMGSPAPRKRKAKKAKKATTTRARTVKAPKAKKPLTAAQAARKAKNKAKYAAWKAAGKPGTFFQWAKANP